MDKRVTKSATDEQGCLWGWGLLGYEEGPACVSTLTPMTFHCNHLPVHLSRQSQTLWTDTPVGKTCVLWYNEGALAGVLSAPCGVCAL